MPLLRTFDISNNLLEEVDGRVFITNQDLESVNLSGNNIRAIGSSFLNINPQIRQLRLSGNECIELDFIYASEFDLTGLREELSHCFENSPWGTHIFVNIVGSLDIFNEANQVIIRID